MEEEIFEIEFCKYFTSINLPTSFKDKSIQIIVDGDNKKNSISNLKRINLFVGENNSGKSYLLRELYKDQDIFNINNVIADEDYFIKKYNIIINDFDNNAQILTKNNLSHVGQIQEFQNEIAKIIKTDQLQLKLNFQNQLHAMYNYIKNNNLEYDETYINKDEYQIKNVINTPENRKLKKIFIYNFRSLDQHLIKNHQIDNIFKNFYQIDKLYISNNEKLIDGNTNQSISFNFENGKSFYEELKLRITDTEENREVKEDYEKFLSDSIFKKRVTVTPNTSTSNLIHFKIGDDREKSIYDLGTGIQMIILLTWPLFTFDSGIVYIEEPELFLHPKLQYQLIEIYSNSPKAKNFQFFITTHSNHIIDSIGNEDKISVYTVEKNSDKLFKINNTNYGDSKPYELLGVKPSSLSIANCLIWVEGPSDMIYFKKWINLVDPTLVSGSHFEVALYGGSLYQYLKVIDKKEITEEDYNDSINEFIQILRVNPNFLFIADSDLDSYNDCGYNIKYENIVNDLEKYFKSKPFIFTSGRTIENYITPDMIYSLTKVDSNIQPIDKYEVFFHKDTKVQSYYRKNLLPLPRESSDNLINNKVIFSKRISKAITVDHLKNSPSWVTPNTKETLYFEILNVVNKIRNWNHLEPLN